MKIEMVHMQLNNNVACASCNVFSKQVDTACIYSKIQYQHDLTNWLFLNSPVMDGDKLIIGNSKKYDFPFEDGTKLISELVMKYGLENSEYHSKDEKRQIVNIILGFLYDDLYDRMKMNPAGTLIGLLNCLEYNRFISISMIGWMKEKQAWEKGKDKFVDLILDTFNMLNQFTGFNIRKYNKDLDVNELYVKLEALIAGDKSGIEHGIEVIFDRYLKQTQAFDIAGEVYITEVLCILRAINALRNIKVLYTEGERGAYPLIFNNKGEIRADIFSEKFTTRYIQDMTNQKPARNMDLYNEDINEVVKEHFGFSFDTINNILKNISELKILGDDFLAAEMEVWINVFQELGQCKYEVSKALFEYLLFSTEHISVFDENSRKNERITRKPIIILNENALCTVSALFQALMFFKIDILEKNINDEALLKKLAKLHEHIDLAFEGNVVKELILTFPNAYIRGDMKESDYSNMIDLSDFPGQIDIMLLLENKIFVIECKNFSLKTDIKPRANEYSKLTKSNHGTIQGKLHKKVAWTKNNIEAIVELLGGSYHDFERYDVFGAIVTRSFSMVSMEEELKYPVITWTRLPEWIKQFEEYNRK